MRLTWLSNAPWAPTGYGNQSKLFLPELAETLGHEIGILSFYGLEGGILHWNGMQVYPRGFDPYGNDVITAHTIHFQARLCISLMDSWVINVDAINQGSMKWVPWFPIDHTPLPPPIYDRVSKAYKRIVFSKFGQKQVEDAGLDCYYVPHGIDTKMFHPVPMKEARDLLGFPQDKFIIGMIAANKGNPSRKAFPQNLEAFAKLRQKHDDVLLYLHCSKSEHGEHDGVNLPEICEHLGLVVGEDVMFCDPYSYMLGYSDVFMNALYNSFDVHLLVSMGEGFGIPIVEAQSAGCPVIVGDWTSMGELCFSGWKVPLEGADPYWTPLGAYQFVPRIDAIYEQMESAYRMKGNQTYRKHARKGALRYDKHKITKKYWKPVLEEIEGLLEKEEFDVQFPTPAVDSGGSGQPEDSEGIRLQGGDREVEGGTIGNLGTAKRFKEEDDLQG